MIFTVGESLIDIIIRDEKPVSFLPGGSMLNTSISLGRLGCPVSFISECGLDFPGEKIVEFLKDNFVNTSFLHRYKNGKTALALAFLNSNADATYEFYKAYPCDRLPISVPDLKRNDILAFGSYYAIQEETNDFYSAILQKAIQTNVVVLYDPNIRNHKIKIGSNVWMSFMKNISSSNIIRGSQEDFIYLFSSDNVLSVWNNLNLKEHQVLVYTAAEKDVTVITHNFRKNYPVEKITPLSTIGAGDTFNAGILYSIQDGSLGNSDLLKEECWDTIISRCIRMSSHVCQKYENYISSDYRLK